MRALPRATLAGGPHPIAAPEIETPSGGSGQVPVRRAVRAAVDHRHRDRVSAVHEADRGPAGKVPVRHAEGVAREPPAAGRAMPVETGPVPRGGVVLVYADRPGPRRPGVDAVAA